MKAIYLFILLCVGFAIITMTACTDSTPRYKLLSPNNAQNVFGEDSILYCMVDSVDSKNGFVEITTNTGNGAYTYQRKYRVPITTLFEVKELAFLNMYGCNYTKCAKDPRSRLIREEFRLIKPSKANL